MRTVSLTPPTLSGEFRSCLPLALVLMRIDPLGVQSRMTRNVVTIISIMLAGMDLGMILYDSTMIY
jgi:hypothetical protein